MILYPLKKKPDFPGKKPRVLVASAPCSPTDNNPTTNDNPVTTHHPHNNDNGRLTPSWGSYVDPGAEAAGRSGAAHRKTTVSAATPPFFFSLFLFRV